MVIRHYVHVYIRALQRAVCVSLKKATAMSPNAIFFLLHYAAKPDREKNQTLVRAIPFFFTWPSV